MPRITDPFIIIPSRTKDLRICARRLWANGVTLASGIDGRWPQSIVGDGAGGAYVLDSVRLTSSALSLVLSHVDSAGVVTGTTTVASKGSGIEPRARLVPASGGTCIVVWSFSLLGDRLLAQRFDSACAPVWSSAAALFPQPAPARYVMIGAGPDGAGGVVICAVRGGQDFFVQRLNSSGQEVWAGATIALPALPLLPAPEAPQIVQAGPGFLVVFQVPASPTSPNSSIFGQYLTTTGQLSGGTFMIGSGPEHWFDRAGVSRVLSDDNGGFWITVTGGSAGPPATRSVQLLRFNSGATTPVVMISSRTPLAFATYSIAPDGAGGVAVATLEAGGEVGVERFALNGGRVFSVAGATRLTVVTPPSLSDVALLPTAHRVVAIAARDRDSFLIAVQNGASRIIFRCLDGNGLPIGVTNTEISPALGAQSAIRLTQPPLPATTPPAPTDSGNVIGTWHTAAGGTQIISAQKLGCCREVYDIDVVPNPWPLRCAIPIDFPPRYPGTLGLSLQCSREDIGTFGILPVPHLSLVPGVNLPGTLVNRRVPAPSWVRLQFSGVPSDVEIGLFSHNGRKVGIAKPVGGGRDESTVREVAFKPDAKLSYALAVTRAPGTESGVPLTLGIDVAYGEGRRPVPKGRKARRSRRPTAKRGARKR